MTIDFFAVDLSEATGDKNIHGPFGLAGEFLCDWVPAHQAVIARCWDFFSVVAGCGAVIRKLSSFGQDIYTV